MSGGSGGLRRFVGDPGRAAGSPTPRKPAQPDPPPTLPGAPDTVATPGAPPEAATEKCEMCGIPLDERHGHVVDVEHRSLMCACRACFLLFTHDNAGGRFRAVPDRYLYDPDRPLSAAEWESLGIPVGAAFFLRGEHGVAAFYPSPAGATECLLDLQAWAGLADGHPLLAAAAPEVEAILVRNDGDGGGIECFLVPIDACYELVGTVRMNWHGFDGGPEARERIGKFFARVRVRARPFAAEG